MLGFGYVRQRLAHPRRLVVVVDLHERHQRGAGEVLGHAPGGENRVVLLAGLENASVVAVRQPCDLRLLTGVRPLEEPVALCVIPKVP